VFNPRRKLLYQSFLNCLEDLRLSEIRASRIWINGSFTTLTKYPKDIDLTSFVPFDGYNKTKSEQRSLRKTYIPALDLFFEPEYPKDHQFHSKTLDDETYCLNLFCFDRKGFDKGLIELTF